MIARLRLEVKSQRMFYFVPVIMVWILTPLVCYSYYLSTGCDPQTTRYFAVRTVQQFVPLFAVWWPVFVLKEYLNAPGNELLFVYRFGWDTLLMRMAALWIWYGLHWTVLYLFLAWLIPGIGLLYLLVLAQSFFLIALAYGVAMLTRNTFLPLVLTVLYSLACILFEMPASIFVLNSGLFAWAEILPAAVILPLGAAIALGAYQLEKRLWKNG